MGPKLSKTVINLVELQSNGRANLINLNILNMGPWDPKYRVCSYTPRFSYSVTKTAICHCPAAPSPALVVWVQAGGCTGVYLGRV